MVASKLKDIFQKLYPNLAFLISRTTTEKFLLKISRHLRTISGFEFRFIRRLRISGDPCIISTQNELETAIRLFEINKEPEITIHGESTFVQFVSLLLEIFMHEHKLLTLFVGDRQL